MKKGDLYPVYISLSNAKKNKDFFEATLVEKIQNYGTFESWVVKIPNEKNERIVYLIPEIPVTKNLFGVDFNKVTKGMYLEFHDYICVVDEIIDNNVIKLVEIDAMKAISSNGKTIKRLKNIFYIKITSNEFWQLKFALLSKFSYKFKNQ